jgi:hypothetical protein
VEFGMIKRLPTQGYHVQSSARKKQNRANCDASDERAAGALDGSPLTTAAWAR